ncbi:hypothetical protein GQ55_2G443800 [Panicum hallii var. hallii]|uniref:Uncharacterized protein n=1 Tax=Panicum hallii var. hallii TaxID=1504633 RepID=A0A2T7EYY8_9POAL|nr:hypothetical protein GQ55_2G443800 [Panicum hallii var. hallii]
MGPCRAGPGGLFGYLSRGCQSSRLCGTCSPLAMAALMLVREYVAVPNGTMPAPARMNVRLYRALSARALANYWCCSRLEQVTCFFHS